MVKDLILRQLARASFSVAGNLEESLASYSRSDFAAKVAISAREGREATYWLRLGKESGVLTADECERLVSEAREVSIVLSTIARRARLNLAPTTSSGTSAARKADIPRPRP